MTEEHKEAKPSTAQISMFQPAFLVAENYLIGWNALIANKHTGAVTPNASNNTLLFAAVGLETYRLFGSTAYRHSLFWPAAC